MVRLMNIVSIALLAAVAVAVACVDASSTTARLPSTGAFRPKRHLLAVGSKCTAFGVTGTCQTLSNCANSGKASVPGFCPNDPANVQCCVSKPCSGGSGICMSTLNADQCKYQFVSNQCPGDNTFKCCKPSNPVPKPPVDPVTPGGGGGDKSAVATYADKVWNCAVAPTSATAACSKVDAGSGQDAFQCAEFVARALAAGGFIPGLGAYADSVPHYTNYKYTKSDGTQGTYNLRTTSIKGKWKVPGLEDLLKDMGWKLAPSTSDSTYVKAATVVFTLGQSGGVGVPWGHVIVGVGANLLDAHNVAHYHIKLASAGRVYGIYNPPQ